MDLLVAHRAITLVVVVLLALTLAFWVVWRAGVRHGAVEERVAALDVARGEQMRKITQADHARDSVARANDALHATNAALHARNDTLARQVTEARSEAIRIRSRLTIGRDTATLRTDTGTVRIPIPDILARQLAQERVSMDSAYRVLERSRDSLLSENRAVLKEAAGLRVEIALDSVERARYRALVDSSASEIRVLKSQSHPHGTFTEGAVVGAFGTLAALLLALVAH